MQKLRKTLEIQFLKATILSLLSVSILLPTQALANCSYPNDQRLEQAQRNCANDPARTWMCEMNRCVTTAEAEDLREKFKDCAELQDDSARKSCHDKFAKDESGLKKNKSGKGAKGLAMTAATINGINAAMMFFSTKGATPGGGACISRKIYMAAAVVSVLAELYLMMMVDKKLKKVKDKYAKEQVEEEAYAAQMRALQYLKEEQETIASMAKTRKNAYTLQMALYGATTVAAILEITLGKTPPAFSPTPCLSKEAQAAKDAAANNTGAAAGTAGTAGAGAGTAGTAGAGAGTAGAGAGAAGTGAGAGAAGAGAGAGAAGAGAGAGAAGAGAGAGAAGAGAAGAGAGAGAAGAGAGAGAAGAGAGAGAAGAGAGTAGAGAGAGTAGAGASGSGSTAASGSGGGAAGGAGASVASVAGGFMDILGTSEAIAITSGTSLVFATFLRQAAAKQEKEAKSNVGKVDELISKFQKVMDGSSYCSPAQRENLDNPQCYCYESNGDKNMNRTNSQACVALWAQNERNLMVGAGNYAGKVNPKIKTCMLLNGQVDRACKCRQMINKSTGENACMKVPMGTNNLGSIGTALGVSGLGATVGNLANGNSNFGSLNSNAIGKQAAKNRKIADQLISKLNNDRAKDGLPPVNPFSERTAGAMLSSLKKGGVLKANAPTAASLAVSARPSGGNLAAAINKAEGKTGITKKTFMKGGRGAARRKGGSGGGDQFAFLNGGGNGGGKVAGGFASKKYNYKDNDIVKNKGVSIWKVISSRYATSGVRRLFEDEKK